MKRSRGEQEDNGRLFLPLALPFTKGEMTDEGKVRKERQGRKGGRNKGREGKTGF